MYVDFTHVWHAVGWDGFGPVEENGSRLLTIQFLCTLREEAKGVLFRFFGNTYYYAWRDFSHLLGFSDCLPISLEKVCHSFNRHEFGVCFQIKLFMNSLHLGAMRFKT